MAASALLSPPPECIILIIVEVLVERDISAFDRVCHHFYQIWSVHQSQIRQKICHHSVPDENLLDAFIACRAFHIRLLGMTNQHTKPTFAQDRKSLSKNTLTYAKLIPHEPKSATSFSPIIHVDGSPSIDYHSLPKVSTLNSMPKPSSL